VGWPAALDEAEHYWSEQPYTHPADPPRRRLPGRVLVGVPLPESGRVPVRAPATAPVPEGIAADILGHEKKTLSYGLYSSGSSMQRKREAVEKLAYPSL
jgi:hypothetical protein